MKSLSLIAILGCASIVLGEEQICPNNPSLLNVEMAVVRSDLQERFIHFWTNVDGKHVDNFQVVKVEGSELTQLQSVFDENAICVKFGGKDIEVPLHGEQYTVQVLSGVSCATKNRISLTVCKCHALDAAGNNHSQYVCGHLVKFEKVRIHAFMTAFYPPRA